MAKYINGPGVKALLYPDCTWNCVSCSGLHNTKKKKTIEGLERVNEEQQEWSDAWRLYEEKLNEFGLA